MFVIFAALQYNDAQPVMWMTAYGVAAVLSGFAAANQTFRLANIATIVFITIWLLISLPDFIDVMLNGLGDNSFKTKSQYINEFFGLIVIISALAFQLKISRTPQINN